MKPKHLLLVPACVWALIAAAFLLGGERAMDYFAVLWFMNDVAIAVAVLGILLHLLKGPPMEGPRPSEWTGWNPQEEMEGPLEEMLVRMARMADAEARRP